MTYACPAWEFAAETHLLKLQRLQIHFDCPDLPHTCLTETAH
jgi:hypothetical protein